MKGLLEPASCMHNLCAALLGAMLRESATARGTFEALLLPSRAQLSAVGPAQPLQSLGGSVQAEHMLSSKWPQSTTQPRQLSLPPQLLFTAVCCCLRWIGFTCGMLGRSSLSGLPESLYWHGLKRVGLRLLRGLRSHTKWWSTASIASQKAGDTCFYTLIAVEVYI
jgi:hypothetical protein